MIVGIDMGGTHIDGVIIKDERVVKTIKRLTDRNDLFTSIWKTLEELLKDYDKTKIKRINLSTTISTNAIVENTVAPVGMIIQSGPGLQSDFLTCGNENSFVSGYVDHRGVVVEDIDIVEIERAKNLFKEKGIASSAVVSKFSTRNPKIELTIKKILGNEFEPITLGHRMSGKLNFPRRVFTSYLNSAVHSTFNQFSTNIKKSLKKEGIDTDLFILKADGGTMDIDAAEKKPVETILSGPAASFMGMSAMIETRNDDGIFLDIGGTTTDIFFMAGRLPLFEPEGAKISTYNTLVRAVYSVSIGLGGDSCVRVENGNLMIGPRREGRPYAFGGPSPTPTDAMIYVGLMDAPEGEQKAAEAMKALSEDLHSTPKETGELILTTMAKMIKAKTDELLLEINSKPIYTVEELLHGKILTPQFVNIIGGPAAVLSSVLEKEYQFPCYYPHNYDVANAIGAALAKPTLEITMVANTSQGVLTVPECGVYEKIPRDYFLEDAKKRAIELLREFAVSNGMVKDDIETEITEESSFNMVRGFSLSGKNIRIKAQVKPGHILRLRSDDT
ncbi:MAG TPA: hydantoinase/oxoprolinase family protein [Treponemataceae bacterium]|nr:hydantoinase/oxoprolinase family protein [Treponemataceae bacterium]